MSILEYDKMYSWFKLDLPYMTFYTSEDSVVYRVRAVGTHCWICSKEVIFEHKGNIVLEQATHG